MDCPECKTANSENARFCRQCGCELKKSVGTPSAALSTEAAAAGDQCTHCDAPLRPGAAFCGRCGTSTKAANRAVPSAPEAEPVAAATRRTASAQIPSASTCPHCDAPLRPGAAFCGRCGMSTVAPVAGQPEPDKVKVAERAPAPTRESELATAAASDATGTPAAPAASQCTHCDAPLRPSATFCARCGTPTHKPVDTVAEAVGNRTSDTNSIWDTPSPAVELSEAAPAASRPEAKPPLPASEPAAVRSTRVSAARGSTGKRPPMLAMMVVASVVVALLVGGIAWWRLSAPSAPAPAAATPEQGQSDEGTAAEVASPGTAPDGSTETPSASAQALPFAGDWIVEKDFDNPGQLPDVGVIRFSANRLRFNGETSAVHYLARGDDRFDIRFVDEGAGEEGGGDGLSVQIADTDHVTLSGSEFALGLVRRDSPAGQAVLANAAPQLPPPSTTVSPPAQKPAPKPAPARAATPDPILVAVNASLDEGRRCMASKKYDCAISSANGVLRLAPNNRTALAMKREAEAAQARALSEIEIR